LELNKRRRRGLKDKGRKGKVWALFGDNGGQEEVRGEASGKAIHSHVFGR
jgi:hypothetical protein